MVPVRDLRPYIDHLPAFQAQDALDRIAQHRAGAGTMDESSQKSFMRELRRAASAGRMRVEKATAASLALIGIQVETLPAPEEGGPDD